MAGLGTHCSRSRQSCQWLWHGKVARHDSADVDKTLRLQPSKQYFSWFPPPSLFPLPFLSPAFMAEDSPLSIAANVVGLLTFVVAVIAGFYARALSLRARMRIRDDNFKVMIDMLEAF